MSRPRAGGASRGSLPRSEVPPSSQAPRERGGPSQRSKREGVSPLSSHASNSRSSSKRVLSPALLSRVELAQQLKESGVSPRSSHASNSRSSSKRECCVPALLSRVELAQQLVELRAAEGRRRAARAASGGDEGAGAPPPGARESERRPQDKRTQTPRCRAFRRRWFDSKTADLTSGRTRATRATRARASFGNHGAPPSLSLNRARVRHNTPATAVRSSRNDLGMVRRRSVAAVPNLRSPREVDRSHHRTSTREVDARERRQTRARSSTTRCIHYGPPTSSERRTTHSCAARSCVRDRSARPIHTARAPETTHDVSRSSSRCHTRARDPFERIRSPTVIALERNHSPTAIHSNGTVLRPQYPFERDRSPTAIHSNGTVLRPRYPFERDHSPTAISIRTNPNLLEEGALARGGHGEEAADERVEGLHVALSRPLLASREAMRSLRGTLPALPAHLRVALSQLLLVSR